MSNEELIIYIEGMLESLKSNDTNDFIDGYIRALENLLEQIKG